MAAKIGTTVIRFGSKFFPGRFIGLGAKILPVRVLNYCVDVFITR
jgi:hypothetical protein